MIKNTLELGTINKLFLELSQVVTATTKAELDLADTLEVIIKCIEKKQEVPHLVIVGAKGLIEKTRL